MKLKQLLPVMMALVLAAYAFAMPPREGVTEPEALKAMRLKGMDSPKRGIEREFRTKAPGAKISGNRKYPVVMGYFTDLAAINTQAEFQGMLFNTGANNKSVNNYYRDMSYNAMSCSGLVDNWRTSNNTVAYYSVNSGLNGGTTANTYEFIRKVLAHADSFYNFADSSYDRDHDGYVDVLWVIHAGKGAEEGASNIWSHSFYLSGFGSGATYYTTNDISPFTGNPVRIDDYIINPERTNYADGNNSTTEMIGCGVFCHEFGHALGLPDLYDTDDSDPGIGNWSLMAGGSWGANGNTGARPAALDLWCRRFLGWANPLRVTSDNQYTVNSIMTTDAGSSYKLARLGADTTKQFWLIENRYKNAMGPVSSVRWDSLLYGQGLAIYHIDSTYTTTTYLTANTVNSSDTRPYGVAMEETDMTTAGYSSELYNGTNQGDAADVWNSGTQANFDSMGTAYPVTYYNGGNSTTGGAHSLTAVRAIPAASAAMACSLLVGVPAGVEGETRPAAMPGSFALLGARPNPARGLTIISYQLPAQSGVTLEIYNLVGQRIHRYDLGMQGAGIHNFEWNAAGVSKGVYLYKLTAGDISATRKLVVLE
jgi:M6 family metalloprotease-like protein